jgi:phosphate/sulfate permease
MDMSLFIICLTAVIGLYMAWNIGANDVANSMADAVGSKALSIKQSVILAVICEVAGAVLVGSHCGRGRVRGLDEDGTDCGLLVYLPHYRRGVRLSPL